MLPAGSFVPRVSRVLEVTSARSQPKLNCKGIPVSKEVAILQQLMAVIQQRKENPPERSYTSHLLAGGVAKIGAKVTEEAGELVEAAGETGEEGRQHFIHEAADLLFHTMVLMAYRDVTLGDVADELGGRFGVSGLDEKAARSSGNQSEAAE